MTKHLEPELNGNSIKPCVGDRIRLLMMANDPHPIVCGTKGTITFVRRCRSNGSERLQVGVDWDNGRQLMLVVPPDDFIFIAERVSYTPPITADRAVRHTSGPACIGSPNESI